jgi:murein endopeptidase
VKAVKLAILLSAVLATSISLNAADQTKKKAESSSKVADSGSFGIFMNGKRVGTETFNITETPNADHARAYSTASSEIKFDDGHFMATQTA